MTNFFYPQKQENRSGQLNQVYWDQYDGQRSILRNGEVARIGSYNENYACQWWGNWLVEEYVE